MHIDDSCAVEIVGKFSYPGDMLSVDGDADASVTSRIHSGWFKFRSVASFLTAKDVSLLLQEKFYHTSTELKGSVKELNMCHNYEMEIITRKASDAEEYIELLGSSARDRHARRI